jgi:diguanylate cyclase (GGDEF)-like protein
MESSVSPPRSVSRLFAVYAIASLVPVLALGVVLADSYHQDANSRGLAEGRAEAALLARTAVQPLVSSAHLHKGLSPAEINSLDRVSSELIQSGQVVRLRIRALDGAIEYASDGDTHSGAADDEALDAAHGEVVSEITHLNADSNPDGTQGIKAAEIYRPLVGGSPLHRIGVLELYLPYAPIARDVTAGLDGLYRDLGVGLAMLYMLLAVISYSATRRLRAQVERNGFLAEHDLLTGLPNRTLFHRRVIDAIAAADRDGVAVAVIDLDRFKEVNDTLGHANGDVLLREIGRRLAAAAGAGNTVARLGGDEFGVILTGVSTEAAHDTLVGLRHVVQQDVEVSSLPLAVDASVGFALAPQDGITVDALLQHADVAMYDAKTTHAGVKRYDPCLDHYDSTKLALVAELKRAIAGDELVLHYQPKAAVATGDVVAVEALVRWNHPERGLLFPDAFLPIAEQTGIIDSLTRWVLRSALEQIQEWGPSAGGLSVAINISARNLSRDDFASTMLSLVRSSGVTPSRLLFEITETALVADPERAGQNLRRLTAAGIRISLDDFGQGQTSLGYLSTLPLHEVKIDKSFVLDMLDDRTHAAIVRSVIELAHNLGFEVVAEGVETEPILSELESLGCDIAQGYLLARPMPPRQLPGWLLEHRRQRDVVGV